MRVGGRCGCSAELREDLGGVGVAAYPRDGSSGDLVVGAVWSKRRLMCDRWRLVVVWAGCGYLRMVLVCLHSQRVEYTYLDRASCR
jgi:hypothetical protein